MSVEPDAVVAAIEAARRRICVKPPPRRAAQINIFDVLAFEEPLDDEGCGQCGGWPPFGGCDECGREPPPSGPVA